MTLARAGPRESTCAIPSSRFATSRVGIVADDLTSAADHAVGFARAGLRATVALSATGSLDGDVTAVDVDSRALDPRTAAGRVTAATAALARRGILVKTIDSTLRGNVGAELRAALSASGRDAVLVAPAFPRYGRRTVDGVQELDGVPVHLGQAGHDPVAPATVSDLVELTAGLRTRVLGTDDAADPRSLAAALADHQVVIADASEDAHLDALIRAVGEPHAILWAGSTGLSQAFGRVWTRAGHPVTRPTPAQRVVVAVGSLDPVTRRQAQRLAETEALTVDAAWDRPGWSPPSGRISLLMTPARSDGPADPGSARAVADALGRAVAACVRDGADAIVLTGGDTAIAALRALGVAGFSVTGEIEPGIALGRLDARRPIGIVTKAGGFGGSGTLVACVRALTGETPV